MRRTRSLRLGLLALITILSLLRSDYVAWGSRTETGRQMSPELAVVLRAASGSSIKFKEKNGALAGDTPASVRYVPHLVLRRNGALTDPEERTLVVEVSGIEVPPPGVMVSLSFETQHGDPDVRDEQSRLPVWRDLQWIANPTAFTQTGSTVVFTHTFLASVTFGTRPIPTPTDYFRYEVAVVEASEPSTSPVDTSAAPRSVLVSGDHAFLMESQWIARLPDVQEVSPGAAPDELIVYYADMFPFQRNGRQPDTRLPRDDVSDFVASELVPRMAEAFRVQTDDWGFPWHSAWIGYRRGDDAERLSVALTDGRTWFHGTAPLRANSGISINVASADNADYETLLDAVVSSFHHELFHHLQRNLNLSQGGDGGVDGREDAWQFFTEGTAVLASSVGQPEAQFGWQTRAYLSKANAFIGYGGIFSDLNTSYEELNPYRAAIYWRFLYEQCGEAVDGSLDPALGMRVIRRALTILYSGEVVEISASTDLIGALPKIMDRALSQSSCRFDSYEESLAAFTRAIYALQLENGRCVAPGSPAGCWFYDPYALYTAPTVARFSQSGMIEQYRGKISTSFGLDFVDVVLDPSADGRPLELEFQAAPGGSAEFIVEAWALKDQGEWPTVQPVPSNGSKPTRLKATTRDGRLSYVVPAIDTAETNRVGILIARVDANQRVDPVGAYAIFIR